MHNAHRFSFAGVPRRASSLVVVVGLALFAVSCGSDSPSGNNSVQTRVVDQFIERAAEAGFAYDRECVDKLIAQLSDSDLALLGQIVSNTDPSTTDPTLSPEGEDIGEQTQECAGNQADPALVDQAAEVLLESDDGASLDADCVRKNLALLDEGTLQLIAQNVPDSTDPRLAGAAFALFECAFSTSDDAATSGLDACTLVTADELTPIFAGLTAGEQQSTQTAYGRGSECTFSRDDGTAVRLLVIEDADVSAFQTEATNGNGIDDGEPIEGIGDVAFGKGGSVNFAVGDTLVLFFAFPSRDVEPIVLTTIAAQIAERLAP